MNIFRSNELGIQEIMVSPYDFKLKEKAVKLEIMSPLLTVSKCHQYLPSSSVTLAFAGSCAYLWL